MKYCEKCGAQAEDNMLFCQNCGTRMDSVEAKPQLPVKPSPSPPAHDRHTAADGSDSKLWIASIVMALLGLIIAKATDTFGIGEILVLAGLLSSFFSKKKSAIVVACLCVWFTITLWFVGW